MNERPILFSAPMVRALLDGTKTQTRRVVKNPALLWLEQFEPQYVALPGNHLSPYGYAGDRLWVRETWSHSSFRGQAGEIAAVEDRYGTRTSATTQRSGCTARFAGHQGIHMPRWASRIDLEVTALRIERLLDISAEDCFAEGIAVRVETPAKTHYARLWEQINGAGSWAANPWVWAVEFKRIKP